MGLEAASGDGLKVAFQGQNASTPKVKAPAKEQAGQGSRVADGDQAEISQAAKTLAQKKD